MHHVHRLEDSIQQKISILPKLIYIFNTITFKIPARILVDTEVISKVYIKKKRNCKNKNNSEREESYCNPHHVTLVEGRHTN